VHPSRRDAGKCWNDINRLHRRLSSKSTIHRYLKEIEEEEGAPAEVFPGSLALCVTVRNGLAVLVQAVLAGLAAWFFW
jgi:hypothetical protein